MHAIARKSEQNSRLRSNFSMENKQGAYRLDFGSAKGGRPTFAMR